MDIININIDDLNDNPIQQPKRTEPRYLKKLKLSIQQYGLLQPITVTKEKIIVDGHRRTACMRDLGFKEVPCIMYNGEVDDVSEVDLFTQSNGEGKMNLNIVFYINAYLQGGNIPTRIMQILMFVVEKTNRKFLRYLAEKEVSPLTVRQVFHSRYKEYSLEDKVSFEFFCKWIIENSCSRFFRRGKIESKLTRQRNKIVEKIKDDNISGKISKVDWITL